MQRLMKAIILLVAGMGLIGLSVSCRPPVVSHQIGVYTDQECATPIASIDFGDLERGATTNWLVYIRNEGNTDISITIDATGLAAGVSLAIEDGSLQVAEGAGTYCILELATSTTAMLGDCTFDIVFTSK